jgi:hypothetical protein
MRRSFRFIHSREIFVRRIRDIMAHQRENEIALYGFSGQGEKGLILCIRGLQQAYGMSRGGRPCLAACSRAVCVFQIAHPKWGR